MSDCKLHLHLSAYHDGELGAELRGKVEEHLRTCQACVADLADMRDMSAQLAGVAESNGIQRGERRRMHEAVDAAMSQQSSMPLLRTAGLLTALAASVL